MKNSDIHNGLPQKEIRDFLSMTLLNVFEAECDNKKEILPYDGRSAIEWAIRDIESQIAQLQKSLTLKKQMLAVTQLISKNDWQEFDVSDETTKDLGRTFSMGFIGTKSEYEKLLKQIEQSK